VGASCALSRELLKVSMHCLSVSQAGQAAHAQPLPLAPLSNFTLSQLGRVSALLDIRRRILGEADSRVLKPAIDCAYSVVLDSLFSSMYPRLAACLRFQDGFEKEGMVGSRPMDMCTCMYVCMYKGQ